MNYAEAGVDVDVEAEASRILYNAAKKKFENRKGVVGDVIMPFDDFSGLRAVNVGRLPKDTFMSIGFDTVGTKVDISQRMNKHDTIAFDLFAMVCDDAVIRGGEPVLIGSNLDVTSLGTDDSNLWIIEQLAEGYVAAANEANVAIINGELCQIGGAVGGYRKFAYNWGAAALWFAKKEKLLTGREVRAGDSVVVLKEDGFRTNGITLMRKIFESHLGREWHEEDFRGQKLGMHALAPSRIYSKALVHMHGPLAGGCCEIHGVAHITGGGLLHKLGRVLKPSGLGARLDNLFDPCSAMLYCQEIGKIPDTEAYKTWNMGQGLVVITPEPENVIREAKRFSIEGKIAGEIITGGQIEALSRGVLSSGEKIMFDVRSV